MPEKAAGRTPKIRLLWDITLKRSSGEELGQERQAKQVPKSWCGEEFLAVSWEKPGFLRGLGGLRGAWPRNGFPTFEKSSSRVETQGDSG